MDTVTLGIILAAAVAVIGASGTAVVLAVKLAGERSARAELRVDVAAAKVEVEAERRERSVAIARSERYLADLNEYKAKARAEVARLVAKIEEMRDAPHILDPDSRRARWGELLSQAGTVSGLLEHDPGAVGADPPSG